MMNPAELAKPFAEKAMLGGLMTWSQSEGFEVEEQQGLMEYAQVLRLLPRQYEVRTDAAQILPHEWEEDKIPWRFDELAFQGELTAYAVLKSPRSMGRRAINSLCLTFEDITLLRHNDQIEGVRLHVPVFSVRKIDELAA